MVPAWDWSPAAAADRPRVELQAQRQRSTEAAAALPAEFPPALLQPQVLTIPQAPEPLPSLRKWPQERARSAWPPGSARSQATKPGIRRVVSTTLSPGPTR